MMTRLNTKGRIPIPLRYGLVGAAIGLAVAMVGRFLFGDLTARADLVVGPMVGGSLMAGAGWLHLVAASGEWRAARWGAPAALVFVGSALMFGNLLGNVAVGVLAGLLFAAWALWYVPRAAASRRDA